MSYLTRLFNNVLNFTKVPSAFKDGLTITLHKGNGKSKTDPNNYRAISLLPAISKIFEKEHLPKLPQVAFEPPGLFQFGVKEKETALKVTPYTYVDLMLREVSPTWMPANAVGGAAYRDDH